MNSRPFHYVLPLAILLAASPIFALAESPATQPTDSDDSDAGLVFTGPVRIAPSDVVAPRSEHAEARGKQDAPPVQILVCAPADIGFTNSEQPKFVWFLDTPTDVPLVIRVSDPYSKPPLRDVDLWKSNGAVPAGIHLLDTTGSALRLVPGRDYHWTIKLVYDETNNPHNGFSSALIRLIDKQDPRAAHGAYYDVLARCVEHLAKADPDQPEAVAKAKHYVEAILKQVDLPLPKEMHVIEDQAIAATPHL